MRFQFEPPPPAGKLTREETKAAYERHALAHGAHDGKDWEKMGHIFAENATYHDTFYGWLHGREEITRWLHDSMQGLEDWTYPVQWVAIDEGRVVVHWLNRLPGQRPDGTYYEFAGASLITFDDDGKVIRQVDLYDGIDTLMTLLESKLGTVGYAVRRGVETAAPVMRESVRALYRFFDKKT